jgi:hypothetical protein
MAHTRRKQLAAIIFLAAAFVFFNYFGQYLEAAAASVVPLWLVAPFVLFLVAIAVVPFVDRKWWERSSLTVAVALGGLVAGYYGI